MTNFINTPNLFIYTALECEAKPLIKQFELKKENFNSPFPIYKNDSIVLTISGVGKVAMAGAVAYSQAIFQPQFSPVLINIGIAGHKFEPIGEILLASKIVDKDSDKRFYPQLIRTNLSKTSEVQTSSKPCTEYSASYMNDMEASAFYETSVRFSSNELIHSIKVISDNEQSAIESINAKKVSQLISNQLTQIEQLLNHWVLLQKSVIPSELKEFNLILQQWNFTVSGKIRLKSLLSRWQMLSAEPWLANNQAKLKSSKDVLKKLEIDINFLKVNL
jgi:nucleoside phosphorylase